MQNKLNIIYSIRIFTYKCLKKLYYNSGTSNSRILF